MPPTAASDSVGRLLALRGRDSHVVVGLMSGTSADGIDAALVRLADAPSGGVACTVLAFRSEPHPRAIADRVLRAAAASAREIAALDVALGERFAQAVLDVAAAGGVAIEGVDLVGSHGQTICHVPPGPREQGATLDIGCPARIAERTGRPVVSDFRARDLARGGQGAPLVPLVDHLLFGKPGERRVLLNVGGIANVTAVDGDLDHVLAFDTGPGNALLDALVRLKSGGDRRYDEGGALALAGTPLPAVLDELLAHPFLRAAPPKSADRDLFGEPLAQTLLSEHAEARLEDLLATAAAWTAESIANAVRSLPAPFERIDRVIAAGGGVHNAAVMNRLRAALPGIVVETTAAHGIDPDAKEAIAFAVLARETLLGRPGNLPGATGARGRVVLGSLTP